MITSNMRFNSIEFFFIFGYLYETSYKKVLKNKLLFISAQS